MRSSSRRWIVIALLCVAVFGACTFAERSVPVGGPRTASPDAVNINTAGVDQLAKLPQVGPSLAQKIIEHRERHGPFRRVEHLMLIDGIGEGRFQAIAGLVRVD